MEYKQIEPIIALIVLVCVILSTVYLIKYVNNQENIKENCGWQPEDDYYCYCDKDTVLLKQQDYDNMNKEIDSLTWD